MTRIWWLLTDVSPIAEHAMHTPTVSTPTGLLHGSTRTTAPALLWEQDDHGDETLRSNGWPTWYSRSGLPHSACALSWRYLAPGGTGVCQYPDPRRVLIPLDNHSRGYGTPSVIDTIRRGVQANHHWLWIDSTEELFAVGTTDHRNDLVPADATWTPAEVTATAVYDLIYDAVIADGYEGADGVLPRFTRQTVAQMITDLAELDQHPSTMPGEFPTVRFDGDIAVISWQQHNLNDERVLEIDRCHPDAEGRYSIGAYQWTWQKTRRR